MTMNDAAGTTKAINLTTNITALIVFIMNGKVLLGLGITQERIRHYGFAFEGKKVLIG